MICPDCNGAKTLRALVCPPGELRDVKCDACAGSGEISEAQAERIAAGKRMREERVARGESLREAAKRLGIAPAELSRRERGQ